MTKISYTYESVYNPAEVPSIFLAGPTPRSRSVSSWRPEAVNILKNDFEWDGVAYYPEFRDCNFIPSQGYNDQIAWEHDALDSCHAILMWVPRELNDMPAFTTNVEFGLYVKLGKLYYGRPDAAPKNGYLDYCYTKFTGRTPHNDLKKLIAQTIGRTI